MKILFCSNLVLNEEDAIKKINKKKKAMDNPIAISVKKLTINIINGLEVATGYPVYIINSMSVPSFPAYKQLFIRTDKWEYNGKNAKNITVGKINIKGIKFLIEMLLYRKYINKWIKNNKNEKLCIMVYGRYISHVIAINSIKKKFPDVITCAVLGDLSGSKAYKDTINKGIYRHLLDKLMDIQMKQVLKFDSFVFLTKYMAEELGLSHKPYVVMEGIASDNNSDIHPPFRNEKKILLFTGALSEQFGVKNLVDAFIQIDDLDVELWLAGGGDMNEYIKDISSKHENIKFLGFVPSKKALEYQSQATVLINPRTNEGEYTKYSFPSKTMEYMASGKPVIMYKLDGVPSEYDEYLYYVEDNSIDALKNKIIEVCSKSNEELYDFGMKAREWVLREKNSVAQTRRIINMLEEM